MPYTMHMLGELLVIELADPLSTADLLDCSEALEQLERGLAVTPNRVIDMRHLLAPALDFNVLYATAERRKAIKPKTPIKTAGVATSPAAIGYFRMFQTLMASHPLVTVKLFETFEDAERWALGG